jgi:hypothetical protein
VDAKPILDTAKEAVFGASSERGPLFAADGDR